MKKVFPLFFLIFICVACSSDRSSDKPVLAVSTPPQAQILAELADSAFDIVTVLPPGTNPETYDPAMRERMALSDAKAFFITGVLPFEKALTGTLPEGVKIINSSEGIELITGTHQHSHGDNADPHEHSATDADPHISTSYNNAIIMARNFAKALSEIDPERQELYGERLAAFTERVEKAREEATGRLAASGVHAFAVWHPSLSYFARDFGLHQIAVGQESKEISITALSKIVDEARADSVKVFFFQKAYDSRQAESINKAIGSRLIDIDPLARDWESQLNLITDVLSNN